MNKELLYSFDDTLEIFFAELIGVEKQNKGRKTTIQNYYKVLMYF